jgi:DNA repair exonuclease SbcCD ATPase subunit
MTSADRQDHEEEREEERAAGLVRRVLGSGTSPEERLEEILQERRRELEEHASRLRESIAELERREELLRDSRASVERMLRMGTSDLEAREKELTDYVSSLAEREAALSQAEADLAHRRQELGAVELKRAAVEGRERALESREVELTEREERLESLVAGHDRTVPEVVEIVFLPGERYKLVEIDATPLAAGLAFDVGGIEYEVARVGLSPLPRDQRRCAYLVRGRGGFSESGGNS